MNLDGVCTVLSLNESTYDESTRHDVYSLSNAGSTSPETLPVFELHLNYQVSWPLSHDTVRCAQPSAFTKATPHLPRDAVANWRS